jgi:ABC-2 type transport system permease protein
MSELALSLRRILGLLRRYVYIVYRSWPRYVDLIYPPLFHIILWGFISKHLADLSDSMESAAGILLSGVLLWNVLNYGYRGVVLAFTEDLASRHFAHLFTSPLRSHELVVALFLFSLFRIIIGCGGAALLAIPMQHFSIFAMLGPALAVLLFNLLWFSWSIGLIIAGLKVRLGLAATSLTPVIVAGIHPLSGVYYPIDVLPEWLQVIAWCLPSAPTFEGMRAVLFDGVLRVDLVLYSCVLNGVWTLIASLAFLSLLKSARRHGLLLQVGE